MSKIFRSQPSALPSAIISSETNDVAPSNQWYDPAALSCSSTVANHTSPESYNPTAAFEDCFSESCHSLDRDYDNISSFSSSDEKDGTLCKKLCFWAVDNNITHNAIDALLKILHNAHPYLPLSAKTLLRTEKHNISVSQLCNGEFAYFGLKEGVLRRIKCGIRSLSSFGTRYTHLKEEALSLKAELITVKLNIDGAPLFKSSSRNFWPILGVVTESKITNPFVIGIFCGRQKPNSAADFLHQLRAEFQAMVEPFQVEGKLVCIRPLCLICDAPARSFIKGVKSHSGFNGCEFCRDPGFKDTVSNRMLFREMNAEQRTDDLFSRFGEDGHQLVNTGIHNLLPSVSCIPPEYMHLVLEGVMKRLLRLWLPSDLKSNKRSYLSAHQRNQLSTSVEKLTASLPAEFHRKAFKINDYCRWKATELRTFLLYIAPFCLQHVLKEEYLQHFYLLHYGIYSLCRPNYEQYLVAASQCLHRFVSDFSHLYGSDQMVYTIHCLQHLSQFCERLGSLDSWSSFPFENFLHILGRRIRGNRKPLQQAVNRINEMNIAFERQFIPNIKITASPPNNVVLTSAGVVLIETFDEDSNGVVGWLLRLIEEVYSEPVDSATFHAGTYALTQKKIDGRVLAKCFSCPSDEDFFVIPLANDKYMS